MPLDQRTLITAGALGLALAAGFGLARFTGRPPAPAPSTTAAPPPADTIVVEAAHLATMQIAVERASAIPFTAGIEAPGLLVAAPGGEALVTAQAAGSVVRLNKRLGDVVRAGEALALVSSREAAGMAADRTVADARAALARSNLARERSLFDQKVTARQDLEKAQAELVAAEAEARRARSSAAAAHVAGDGRSVAVVSPISGRVTAAPAALGAFVQPETELFRVADPRLAQVEAAVPGPDAARIRPGDSARVTTSAGAVLTASVRSVTPTLSAETRTATVVLILPAGAAVTPGEAVRVQISPAADGPAAVVVPEEAVQSVNGRDVVFVRTPTGFRAQPVSVSGRSGGRAAVASGLQPGQAVATRNAFLLKAELTKGAGDEE
jgi:cobalt-zinc-cadmium efflux system membrane fusion protein